MGSRPIALAVLPIVLAALGQERPTRLGYYPISERDRMMSKRTGYTYDVSTSYSHTAEGDRCIRTIPSA